MTKNCLNCGLANWDSATACKRCNAPLGASTEASRPRQWVPPPPPFHHSAPPVYPFSSPQKVGGVWKDGSTLVMGKDAVLPPFCVKCNRVVGKPDFKRNLRWHHPALYLLLLPGWLIYLIVAMIIRKRATVYLGLCPDHISQRRIAIAVCWALVLLGLVGIIGGVAYETFEMIGVGGLIITGAAIFSTYGVQPVRVQKMDDHFIWLKRINKDYLARLPELPGRF